ncbi:MAG: nucleoside monophosphate kinase [Patescibacteria group bacterium]
MTQPTTVFFIGKPGCGKGTQARLLAEKTGWTILASGDQFRAIAKEDNIVGSKVKEEIDNGLLAPHWFAMYLYLRALFSLKSDESVVFDGFNRKQAEAELVTDSLDWVGRPYTVLEINISDEEVHRRLEGRKGVEGRADDHAVTKRLEEYDAYTTKALTLFRDRGNLTVINGEQTPEQVAKDIATALNLPA